MPHHRVLHQQEHTLSAEATDAASTSTASACGGRNPLGWEGRAKPGWLPREAHRRKIKLLRFAIRVQPAPRVIVAEPAMAVVFATTSKLTDRGQGVQCAHDWLYLETAAKESSITVDCGYGAIERPMPGPFRATLL